MSKYKILDWDSHFFGFMVGAITHEVLCAEDLREVICDLKQEGVSLIYWAANPNSVDSLEAAQLCGGILVGKKVTYSVSAEEIKKILSTITPVVEVVEFEGNSFEAGLKDLALEAGRHSRFKLDPNFSTEQYERLYMQWMENSINREIADDIFVAYDQKRMVGVVTVSNKNNCCNIGLVAVDPSLQGKKFGSSLMVAALKSALQKNCKYAQVLTQLDNIAACKLYEKFGFGIDSIQNVYHFWVGRHDSF